MESGTGVMIDCNGDSEIKIDRYDGRALLDFIVNVKRAPQQLSEIDQVDFWNIDCDKRDGVVSEF